MATSPTVPDLAPTAAAVKLPLLPLLLCCLLSVVLAVGGCAGLLYFLARSGRLGGATAGAVPATRIEVVAPPATHPVVIEPLLVNLADDDGRTYLRVSIVLGEADDKKKDAEEKPMPGANASLRDTILEVLGRQKSESLLDPSGKERLKKELKAALDEHVPEARVQTVYFTDFLVQR